MKRHAFSPKNLSLPLSLLLLTLLSACESETATNEYSVTAVVEAYLSPGEAPEVIISEEIPYVSSTDDDIIIEDLVVNLTHEGTTFQMTYDTDGHFRVDSSVLVAAGDVLELEFEFNGDTVYATTTVPQKPAGFYTSVTSIEMESFTPGSGTFPSFPDPVGLYWDNPEGDYHLAVIENIEADPQPVNEESEENEDRPQFRLEPEQGTTVEIRSRQFTHYGTHRIILYRLNPDYAALYVDNGSSSDNLQAPSSNIVNGYGIFTGLNADTAFLEVREP